MAARPARKQGRGAIVDNALVREFPPRTLDKVERLLDLLAELDEHPLLAGKFALHGGTAINLFMLDVLRLSVDIRPLVCWSARQGCHARRQADSREVDRRGGSFSGICCLRGERWPCWQDVCIELQVAVGCRPHQDRLHLHEPLSIDIGRAQNIPAKTGARRFRLLGCEACRRKGQGILRSREGSRPLRRSESQTCA